MDIFGFKKKKQIKQDALNAIENDKSRLKRLQSMIDNDNCSVTHGDWAGFAEMKEIKTRLNKDED